MVTTVAARLRNLTGVSAATIKEILASAERAFEKIASAAPNSQHLRWRRAVMLMSFAYNYLSLGDSGEALRRARAAHDIMLALVKEDPANVRWQADLAASLRTVGDGICKGVGDCVADPSEALAKYRASLQIMTQLTEKNPQNTNWQDELGRAHSRIGQVLLQIEGDRAAALSEYRADLDIVTRLAEKDPATWNGSATLRSATRGRRRTPRSEHRAAALAEYRASLDIFPRLAEKDTGNAQGQRDLAVSHERIGTVLYDQGDRAAALTEYRAYLGISQRLAEKDPGNVEWQRDLSIAHTKVGDVLRDQATWRPPSMPSRRRKRSPYIEGDQPNCGI